MDWQAFQEAPCLAPSTSWDRVQARSHPVPGNRPEDGGMDLCAMLKSGKLLQTDVSRTQSENALTIIEIMGSPLHTYLYEAVSCCIWGTLSREWLVSKDNGENRQDRCQSFRDGACGVCVSIHTRVRAYVCMWITLTASN